MFAYGPADVTASQNAVTSCLIQIQIGLLFWYWFTLVVLEKRPFIVVNNISIYLKRV